MGLPSSIKSSVTYMPTYQAPLRVTRKWVNQLDYKELILAHIVSPDFVGNFGKITYGLAILSLVNDQARRRQWNAAELPSSAAPC